MPAHDPCCDNPFVPGLCIMRHNAGKQKILRGMSEREKCATCPQIIEYLEEIKMTENKDDKAKSKCSKCSGEGLKIIAKGLCRKCYQSQWDEKNRSKPKANADARNSDTKPVRPETKAPKTETKTVKNETKTADSAIETTQKPTVIPDLIRSNIPGPAGRYNPPAHNSAGEDLSGLSPFANAVFANPKYIAALEFERDHFKQLNTILFDLVDRLRKGMVA